MNLLSHVNVVTSGSSGSISSLLGFNGDRLEQEVRQMLFMSRSS